ncbi:TPA: recombinase, partial [Escherichia coli]|nr:recombinase [Escherichia coli]
MQKQSYWEKQRQKAMQKLADPAWREEQRAKRLQQAQRQQQRAREKAASPEYRQKKIEKAKQYDQRRKEKAVSAPSKKTRTSRGLKGRSLTADERRIQTAIGTLPCIACH